MTRVGALASFGWLVGIVALGTLLFGELAPAASDVETAPRCEETARPSASPAFALAAYR